MHNYICVRHLCSDSLSLQIIKSIASYTVCFTVFIHGHYWLQTRLMRDKRLHFLSIGTQLESTNKMEKRILNQRVIMANLSLAWTGDYNSLKSLVRDELKLDGMAYGNNPVVIKRFLHRVILLLFRGQRRRKY